MKPIKKMSQYVPGRTFSWVAAAAAMMTFSVTVPVFSDPSPTLEGSPTRLSSNENAFGYTPKAKEAMIAAMDGGSYYNRNNVMELIELSAKKEGVPTDYILPTAGSGPILMMTALAYAEPGKNVVTTEMGYTQLVRKYAARGGDVKYASMTPEMGYDLESIKEAIDENTNVVYICNPNNPTGVLIDPVELKQFVLSVRDDILVFVDEAYLELADSSFSMNTCSSLVKLRKNLIVCRTFSKSYGLAGLRIGYGIGNPDVLEGLKDFYMGAPSYLSAIAAVEALKDKEFMASNVANYKKVRKYVCESFDRMGINYAKPDGAFVYFESGMDQQELRDALKAKGILISGSRVSGVDPEKYSKWARVSIGTMEQMDAFLYELSSILGKT